MTELWKLPRGWRWATMGDVAKVVGGSTPKTNEPSYWGGDIPWITPDDLSGFTGKYIERGRRSITQAGYDSCSTRMVPKGTVLFTSRAPIGYVAIAAAPVCTNQGFKSFICGPDVHPEYVYWYLRYSTDLTKSLASGTTFLELSAKAALRVPIPVPPWDEQLHVVERLEEATSRLAEAIAALKRSHGLLDSYRRAILEQAVTGGCPACGSPAHGDPRQETAEQLLERANGMVQAARRGLRRSPIHREDAADAASEALSGVSLADGWVWARWGDISVSQNGRAFPSAQYATNGIRLLRPGNLHASGRVQWTQENTRRLPISWATAAREYLLGEDELVMNLTAQSLKDEFLGRICRTTDDEPALLNQRIARLMPQAVDAAYIFWVLKSPLFRRFVERLNTGSLIQHMFTSQLDEFLVPLPSPAVQRKIVEHVERQMSIVDQLQDQIASGLRRTSSLERSIADAAFGGRVAASVGVAKIA
jgi:type I restriction enzyme S subunit